MSGSGEHREEGRDIQALKPDRAEQTREIEANARAQARRMLIRPVIDRLHEQGKLEDIQVTAAREIERVHLMLTSFGRLRRASFLSEPGAAGARVHVPDIFRADYQDRYRPWATEVGLQPFTHRLSVFGMTLMVVVDNRVLEVLRSALYRYGEIAGWIEPVGLPLWATA